MKTKYIKINTQGNTDIIDITGELANIVEQGKITDGILFLSVIGSTAGLTTMEFEQGLVDDAKKLFEQFIPFSEEYAHNATWQDANGHSHLRSSLLKTNLFVSVTNGKIDLGTWQQVVLIDFDVRKRERKIVVKILT